MTVTYSLEVSTSRFYGFAKLLARWRGSIYKLVYREMIVFLVLYYSLALLYRFGMNEWHKEKFENMALYCREFTESHMQTMTFVMGFYVSLVVGRWWQIYMNLPWPDRVCLCVTALVQGADERGRMIRRSLARYLNAASVITLKMTSTVVKKRFPTMDHLVDSGVFTLDEAYQFEQTVCPHGKWWVPFVWFSNLVTQARREGRIADDIHLKFIMEEMLSYRGCLGNLLNYDWISVPLVYTQVVTLAIYAFFAATLMGRQFLYHEPEKSRLHSINEYLPIFTLVQFFFYLGWLKVAEVLINPLGEDDDDFELGWLIDRNNQVSLLIVDGLWHHYPKLERDKFWNDFEAEMPYTAAAAPAKTVPFLGSAADVEVVKELTDWVEAIDTIPEGGEELTPLVDQRPPLQRLMSNTPVGPLLDRLLSKENSVHGATVQGVTSKTSLFSRQSSNAGRSPGLVRRRQRGDSKNFSISSIPHHARASYQSSQDTVNHIEETTTPLAGSSLASPEVQTVEVGATSPRPIFRAMSHDSTVSDRQEDPNITVLSSSAPVHSFLGAQKPELGPITTEDPSNPPTAFPGALVQDKSVQAGCLPSPGQASLTDSAEALHMHGSVNRLSVLEEEKE